ncbi:11922_t:CDS:2 [Cetraspora pellucida]|uniref:11922_t:CDS:1 n=1 Tax=Cetraspora pellucida TaxID=1433469 RepID=A0ACA9KI69_9GLOM|nr:11922_t:CDS:2 [Cetraspora pellucida]
MEQRKYKKWRESEKKRGKPTEKNVLNVLVILILHKPSVFFKM